MVVALDYIYTWFSFVAQYRGGPFEEFAAPYAASMGLSADALANLACALMAIPLSALGRLLPSGDILHIYNASLGLFFSFLIYGYESIHAIGSALVVFFMLKFVPKKHVHQYVFVFSFIYLSMSHTWRMYIDYLGWRMDFTGPQMLLTIKMTYIAIDFADGLIEMPSPLEYMGYIFFFPGYLAGPTFEFGRYIHYTTQQPDVRQKQGNTFVNAVVHSIPLFLEGIAFGIVHLLITKYYPVSRMRDASFYAESGFFYKLGIVFLTTTGWRLKYYFGWRIAEVSTVIYGVSFISENGRWDGTPVVDPWGLEFAENWQQVARSWNTYTHLWLKRCVYSRWLPKKKGQKSGIPTFVTFITSAIWHGFYPGYFIAFVYGAIIEIAARRVRRVVRPMVLGSKFKRAYDILGTVITFVLFQMCIQAFTILSYEYCVIALKNTYAYVIILPIVAMVVLSVVPVRVVKVE